MPVVSNTSPVLNLAIIGYLHLLRQQFSQVWLPEAVKQELHLDEELPGSPAIRQAIEDGWLQISTPRRSRSHCFSSGNGRQPDIAG